MGSIIFLHMIMTNLSHTIYWSIQRDNKGQTLTVCNCNKRHWKYLYIGHRHTIISSKVRAKTISETSPWFFTSEKLTAFWDFISFFLSISIIIYLITHFFTNIFNKNYNLDIILIFIIYLIFILFIYLFISIHFCSFIFYFLSFISNIF